MDHRRYVLPLLEAAFNTTVPRSSFSRSELVIFAQEASRLARSFDPKIAEEIGTKVCAQKYGLRNDRKILRGLEVPELTIHSHFAHRS